MHPVRRIYRQLMASYGPQGWWPLQSLRNTRPVTMTKSGSLAGYHPSDYSYPQTRSQAFEVCVGAILTQNAAWTNVEKAIAALGGERALSPEAILRIRDRRLGEIIRPSGYFTAKARKLKEFSRFFAGLRGTPSREALLSVWGIGPETADSMLLYAFRVPSFVVDAYTRRIVEGLGLVRKGASYDKVKSLFEKNLEPDLAVFQECHALLVEHAKRYYQGKSAGVGCPLKRSLTSSRGASR
ncbi:endonuclease III domain-containing protein [Candidatus Woesearchaeota archaeon]|nr:endonuclease III domain-containing protein [Candidatus Woesearchaeota archaeon]